MTLGGLTDERFAKLSATYEAEQAELKQSVENLSAIVEATEVQSVNIKSFLKIVKKYTEPTELTPQLLHEFVDKIVVHEADKSSGKSFFLDTHTAAKVSMFAQRKSSFAENIEVQRRRVFLCPGGILLKNDIQTPMQLISHSPMLAHRIGKTV